MTFFFFIQGVKELEHLNETGELKILLENFEVGSSFYQSALFALWTTGDWWDRRYSPSDSTEKTDVHGLKIITV